MLKSSPKELKGALKVTQRSQKVALGDLQVAQQQDQFVAMQKIELLSKNYCFFVETVIPQCQLWVRF